VAPVVEDAAAAARVLEAAALPLAPGAAAGLGAALLAGGPVGVKALLSDAERACARAAPGEGAAGAAGAAGGGGGGLAERQAEAGAACAGERRAAQARAADACAFF
jgi:hypothetical protein